MSNVTWAGVRFTVLKLASASFFFRSWSVGQSEQESHLGCGEQVAGADRGPTGEPYGYGLGFVRNIADAASILESDSIESVELHHGGLNILDNPAVGGF